VQGMNFFAANLLYHAEEYIAFWIMTMVFEMFELREIYAPSNLIIIIVLLFNNKKNYRFAWTF
jgi:hypothetical protein